MKMNSIVSTLVMCLAASVSEAASPNEALLFNTEKTLGHSLEWKNGNGETLYVPMFFKFKLFCSQANSSAGFCRVTIYNDLSGPLYDSMLAREAQGERFVPLRADLSPQVSNLEEAFDGKIKELIGFSGGSARTLGTLADLGSETPYGQIELKLNLEGRQEFQKWFENDRLGFMNVSFDITGSNQVSVVKLKDFNAFTTAVYSSSQNQFSYMELKNWIKGRLLKNVELIDFESDDAVVLIADLLKKRAMSLELNGRYRFLSREKIEQEFSRWKKTNEEVLLNEMTPNRKKKCLANFNISGTSSGSLKCYEVL